jgi:hypothetical protein
MWRCRICNAENAILHAMTTSITGMTVMKRIAHRAPPRVLIRTALVALPERKRAFPNRISSATVEFHFSAQERVQARYA